MKQGRPHLPAGRRTLCSISLLYALAWPALAQEIRICADEQSHLPFINQAGGGVIGQLVRQAASEVGMTVIFYGAPTTRCREEIRAGIADAFPGAPFTPALLPFMAFPMQNAQPDPAKAVMTARAMVFRRKGSRVDWDGERFTHLSLPALMPFGSVLLSDRLRAMKVPFDDKGKTLTLIFAKLLASRGDVAVGAEFSGRAVITDPRFAGKIEVLPIPFSEEPYFFGVARPFYAANTEKVEQLWEAIGRIRASPAYRANVQKVTAEATRSQKE